MLRGKLGSLKDKHNEMLSAEIGKDEKKIKVAGTNPEKKLGRKGKK